MKALDGFSGTNMAILMEPPCRSRTAKKNNFRNVPNLGIFFGILADLKTLHQYQLPHPCDLPWHITLPDMAIRPAHKKEDGLKTAGLLIA